MMIKNIINYKLNKYNIFLILILALFTPSVFAADFTKDVSTNFLAILFGGVADSFEAVLGSADEPSLLGTAFYYFNFFIATVGAAMVGYITSVALMNSATSGTPLGQKWHSLFLPIRVTFGAGMLMPFASGYNTAQIITMWFILTGVNGADIVWNNVSNKIGLEGDKAISGQALAESEKMSFDDKKSFFKGGGNDVESFLTCAALYQAKEHDPNDPPGTNNRSLRCGYHCSEGIPSKNNKQDIADIIGLSSEEASKCKISCDSGIIAPASPILVNSKNCGYLNMNVKNLDPALKSGYLNSVVNILNGTVNTISSDVIPTTDGKYSVGPYRYNDPLLNQTEKNNMAMVIKNIWQTAVYYARLQEINGKNDNICKDLKKAQTLGWIAAGFDYYWLIQVGNKCGKNAHEMSPKDVVSKNISSSLQLASSAINFEKIYDQGEKASGEQGIYTTGVWPISNSIYGQIDEGKSKTKPNSTSLGTIDVNASFDIDFKSQAIPVFDKILDLLVAQINSMLDVKNLFGYNKSIDIMDIDSIKGALSVDPLHNIASLGNKTAVFVENLFMVSITASISMLVASATLPSWPTGVFMIGFVAFGLLMGIFMFLSLFYPVALVMSVYIPLIPFVIYFTGVVGWLATCVEAMAAAPIVAIGLMSPNGDDVLGQAEQGIKLLINLMIRPALMILGLVAAIILVRISLLIFSLGIQLVYNNGNGVLGTIGSAGGAIAIAYVVVMTITVIVHKSFNLINLVPDKVLTWIGATGTSIAGEAQELMQKTEAGAKEGGELPSKGVGAISKGVDQATSKAKSGSGGLKPPPGEG